MSNGVEGLEPGRKPDLSSSILRLAKATCKELNGVEPQVKAIHAGLERGIIGERFTRMEMVSFGPTVEGVHSPGEKIYIDTVTKSWNFFPALMRNLD